MGRPTKLTPKLIERASAAANAGGALPTIATACGVHIDTVTMWLRDARNGKGGELHMAFLRAIQEGQHQAELRALSKITAFEDSRDAQWWLTHHPRTRDTWSDAAATRRAVEQVLTGVAKGLSESGLTPDQQQAAILAMRANGVGVTDASSD